MRFDFNVDHSFVRRHQRPGTDAENMRTYQGGTVQEPRLQHDRHAELERQRFTTGGRLQHQIVLAADPVRLQSAAEAVPLLRLRANVHRKSVKSDRSVSRFVRERLLPLLSRAERVRVPVAGRARLFPIPRRK